MATTTEYAEGTVAQRLDLALNRELSEGESVVWKGMKLARIEPKGFAIYAFAIPWTAFALFWMAMAGFMTARSEDGFFAWLFPMFGIPFVLVGLGMMATPFLSFFQRGRVLFAVTNRRVLKLSMGGELTVNSVPGEKITDSARRESSDGSGTIDLSLSTDITGYGGRRSRKMQFGRVEDVFEAYQAIKKIEG